MPTVAIVYFSATGNTKLMAEAIAAGVNAIPNTVANLYRITGEQISGGRWQDDDILEQVSRAEAIVLGTPTYMGGVAAQLKAFIDAAGSIWLSQGWKNKIAGGFTHSGSPSGDKQGTLLYLATHAAQHGMIWIGNSTLPDADSGLNELGAFLGPMGHGHEEGHISDSEAKTAQQYGQRIAKATQAWNASQLA